MSGMGAASVLPGQHVNMVGEIRLGEGILEKERNLANENKTQMQNVLTIRGSAHIQNIKLKKKFKKNNGNDQIKYDNNLSLGR